MADFSYIFGATQTSKKAFLAHFQDFTTNHQSTVSFVLSHGQHFLPQGAHSHLASHSKLPERLEKVAKTLSTSSDDLSEDIQTSLANINAIYSKIFKPLCILSQGPIAQIKNALPPPLQPQTDKLDLSQEEEATLFGNFTIITPTQATPPTTAPNIEAMIPGVVTQLGVMLMLGQISLSDFGIQENMVSICMQLSTGNFGSLSAQATTAQNTVATKLSDLDNELVTLELLLPSDHSFK